MADPIAELVAVLERDDSPSLTWVVRWSDGGAEPLAAAWAAASDPYAMIRLLAIFTDDGSSAARRELHRGGFLTNTGHIADVGRYEREGAVAIRRAVPVPPTLADVLAARSR